MAAARMRCGVGMNDLERQPRKVLIDSDAFIAWLLPDDVLHKEATQLFDRLDKEHVQAFSTSVVIGETMTVLSHRIGQALASQFYAQIQRANLPIIFIEPKLHDAALILFLAQTKKGMSYVDCANAVVDQHLGVKDIFSFDGFYKRLGLSAYSARLFAQT